MNKLNVLLFSLFISGLVLFSCPFVLADESISITTYYPSPYGVYNEMRLYPHNSPLTTCDSTTEGTMFYNLSAHELQICNGSGSWRAGGGFWAGSGNDIHNTNLGKVGVGINSPLAPLHVYAATGYGEVRVESVDPTRGSDTHYKADSREWGTGVCGSNYGSLSNSYFITDQTANAGLGLVRLMINTAGNIGIGTTNPTSHLNIYGDAEMKLTSDADPNNYSDIHFDNANCGGRNYVIGNYGPNVGFSTPNSFFIRDNTAGPDRLVITPNGSVGLGYSNPRGRLDVNGLIFFANDDPTYLPFNFPNQIGFHSSDVAFFLPTFTAPGPSVEESDLRLYIEDNMNDRFSIWGQSCPNCHNLAFSQLGHYFRADGTTYHRGNLGIGITPPTHRIHLAGGAYSDGTGSWVSGSDRAYKKDIDYNFQYGLKILEQLKPVYYIHKQDETNKKQIGFIAQDVKEVIPEVVSGEEGTYGLAYDRFVPVLVNAIKELEKQVEDLKAQIDELKRN